MPDTGPDVAPTERPPAEPKKIEGPALPAVEMHLHPPGNPGIGRVGSTDSCTDRKAAGFVRHVAIDVSGTDLAGRFRAGQSFGVIPPGTDPKGKPHRLRLYSIASPTAGEDGTGNILATTVKRTIDEHWDDHSLFLGVASNYLCNLQVGDELTVTGPNGKRFLLPEDPHAHDYVFFATGTGIAPFRGMILDLAAAGYTGTCHLIMGSPYATDLLYHEELLRLASEHDFFHYTTAISRERQEDGSDPMYVQDRLQTHRDQLVAALSSERGLVYVCGIAGMEMGILQRLAQVLPADQLGQYLQIDPEVASDVHSWTRKMLHKRLKTTRRVFLEVY